MCTIIAWVFYLVLKLPLSPFARRIVVIVGWCACVFVVGYTAASAIIYSVLHAPLTYPLWLASDSLRGAQASVSASLSTSSLLIIAKSFLIFVAVTEGLWRLAPRFVEWARTRFYSPVTAFLLVIYFLAAHMWSSANIRYLPAIANPELAFISSLFVPLDPLVTEVVPKVYFSDFARERNLNARETRSTLTVSYSPIHSPAEWHPRNILLIIMESVGSRRLQLYGAPYDDTPQMQRLARNAMVFDRIYVAQAYTSGAMGAIFCSLYPQFGWQPITRSTPNIDVPGLADILAQHGYATAFIHPGQLAFDNEGEFLRDHGFQHVIAKDDDPTVPADSELLGETTAWIHAHSSRPFFLTLWTEDTHHPYFAATSHDYGVADPNLNRYLNAVHSTDQLIGQLADTLDQMQLSDDTLIVITGDHGEAFGEHGQIAHNWTVYDEEMRVPLMLVNRRLFPYQQRVDRLGHQLDIAPTLLALLGYAPPPSWQGNSLFSANATDRAYLFSRYGNYTFGLVYRHFKYIYDFNRKRQELYDLAADPRELHDLAAEPANAATLNSDHLKIEAWILSQRDYLSKHPPTHTLLALGAKGSAANPHPIEPLSASVKTTHSGR
jgi:lipoteichoic acid synthase